MADCQTHGRGQGLIETIAAIATPPGRGGVGIVRLSGEQDHIAEIAQQIIGTLPPPRHALFASFRDQNGEILDQGIALYFQAPHSFTGEHVLELQGHGGPVIMDLLLQRCLQLGARLARPGEFSERAFLNDKLDLAQAEAIADLIDAETQTAARLASRSLQGLFSKRIQALVQELIELRVFVEAAIDFSDEDIDFLEAENISHRITAVRQRIEQILQQAHSGRLLCEGIKLVIAGQPNAGKSSLLNALSESDAAIVTDIPGTTRDILQQQIQIQGVPIHLLDTAGLRPSDDPIEQEGIKRARQALQQADCILWLYDAERDPHNAYYEQADLPSGVPVIMIKNKIDRLQQPAGQQGDEIALSAKTGAGLELLKQRLLQLVGFQGTENTEFLARRRHLNALERALKAVMQAEDQPEIELLAEDLRSAQMALSEITGEFSADDLLGEIFSSFCIGK